MAWFGIVVGLFQ